MKAWTCIVCGCIYDEVADIGGGIEPSAQRGEIKNIWNEIPTVLGNMVGGLVFTGMALYSTHVRTGAKRSATYSQSHQGMEHGSFFKCASPACCQSGRIFLALRCTSESK